jgi:hypothetical protein
LNSPAFDASPNLISSEKFAYLYTNSKLYIVDSNDLISEISLPQGFSNIESLFVFGQEVFIEVSSDSNSKNHALYAIDESSKKIKGTPILSGFSEISKNLSRFFQNQLYFQVKNQDQQTFSYYVLNMNQSDSLTKFNLTLSDNVQIQNILFSSGFVYFKVQDKSNPQNIGYKLYAVDINNPFLQPHEFNLNQTDKNAYNNLNPSDNFEFTASDNMVVVARSAGEAHQFYTITGIDELVGHNPASRGESLDSYKLFGNTLYVHDSGLEKIYAGQIPKTGDIAWVDTGVNNGSKTEGATNVAIYPDLLDGYLYLNTSYFSFGFTYYDTYAVNNNSPEKSAINLGIHDISPNISLFKAQKRVYDILPGSIYAIDSLNPSQKASKLWINRPDSIANFAGNLYAISNLGAFSGYQGYYIDDSKAEVNPVSLSVQFCEQ